MNKHYTLTAIAFVAIATLAFTTCGAQQVEYMTANNVNVGVATGGNLFSKVDTAYRVNPTPFVWDLFKSPKSELASPVLTAALWMSGVDTGGDLHVAAQRYREKGMEFYDGPTVTNYTAAYDSFYKRVFKVTANEINTHRQLSFPVSESQVAEDLLKWPAKGNPYVLQQYGVAITDTLAPFVDADANGIYEPTKGDYPEICGDEAVFFVFNDLRGVHNESQGLPLGFEIRGLEQVFIDNSAGMDYGKRAINNTVFVSYQIKNRMALDYHDFYLSMFEDPDLGCFSNDRVGCDSVRNMAFVYNGTSPDPNCNGITGYSFTNVSFGTISLNHDLSSFCYFTNALGSNLAQSDPDTSIEYRNYMTAHWADGIPFTQGGSGYGGIDSVNFIFPGSPLNPAEWSEVGPSVAAVIPPGDRRFVATTNKVNFAAGETKRYDFAFTNSFDADTNATFLTIVDTLKRDADLVQAFYDNYIANCAYQPVVGVPTLHNNLTVALVPNPATDEVQITSDVTITAVTVYDMQGKAVLTTTGNTNSILLNTKALQRGLYLVKVEAGSSSITKKLALK